MSFGGDPDPFIVLPDQTYTILQKVAKRGKSLINLTGRIVTAGRNQIRRVRKGERLISLEAMTLEQDLMSSLEREGVETQNKSFQEVA